MLVRGVKCTQCGKKFSRRKAELNRSQKTRRKLFCSRSCCAHYKNQEFPHPNVGNLKAANRRDRDSRFRWFISRVRYRVTSKGNRRVKSLGTDLDVAYLRRVWRAQDKVCPITGWRLRLPRSTRGWDADIPRHRRASLDRIDSRLGYVRGNVRFVSVMVNNAKNDFTDTELLDFCRAVAKLHPE